MWRFQQSNIILLLTICALNLLVWRNIPSSKLSYLKLNDSMKLVEDQLRNSRARLENLSLAFTEDVTSVELPSTLLKIETKFTLPSILTYLDHIPLGATMEPMIRVGKLKPNCSIVMGIPTVKREIESYLMRALNSVISKSNNSTNYGIIIFVGETDEDYIIAVAEEIRQKFPKELDSGLIEIISPPLGYYPDFSQMKSANTFGDSAERVKWRRKQNLDYVYLWMSCMSKADYYIQLEDDIVARAGFLDFIENKIRAQIGSWFILEFSNLGFIGKLFKSSSLNMVSEFVLMFWKDKPVDWLLDNMLYTKICDPAKEMSHCQVAKRKIKRRMLPAQFQHIGTHSSLPGKIQKLRDNSFGRMPDAGPSRNPPLANSFSDITIYTQYTLQNLYHGISSFWGKSYKEGSHIVFIFKHTISLSQVSITSGGSGHPKDIFPQGSNVYITPEKLKHERSYLNTSMLNLLGPIADNGTFYIKYDNGSKPNTSSLVIRTGPPSLYWLWISDIYIQT